MDLQVATSDIMVVDVEASKTTCSWPPQERVSRRELSFSGRPSRLKAYVTPVDPLLASAPDVRALWLTVKASDPSFEYDGGPDVGGGLLLR